MVLHVFVCKHKTVESKENDGIPELLIISRRTSPTAPLRVSFRSSYYQPPSSLCAAVPAKSRLKHAWAACPYCPGLRLMDRYVAMTPHLHALRFTDRQYLSQLSAKPAS